MLVQKVSKHLQKLAEKSEAIKRQFYELDKSKTKIKFFSDPLEEEKYQKVKGLIHKYKNRVLILLTLECAAYCRFCTRQRCVSDIKKGVINKNDLLKMVDYIKNHPEIKEIILSGGDPFFVPKTLTLALKIFGNLNQIKVIRIGTRIPVSEPKMIDNKILNVLKKVKQPLYILIHFEHPDELTKETKECLLNLRRVGAILLSQTVFLRGVNDSFETLYNLFSQLIENGVKPYYLFRCDPVKGAERFQVPFKKEVEIATKLRKELSGLANPLYVIDTPCGSGKIPVSLLFWQYDKSFYLDFNGKKIKII